ncbi:hypothetical protein BC829DRAFT_416581 [Chytridium lagenaria]|nr:hypothetical protein BC829DRAFT_416581 [Chytridium lagenaria]
MTGSGRATRSSASKTPAKKVNTFSIVKQHQATRHLLKSIQVNGDPKSGGAKQGSITSFFTPLSAEKKAEAIAKAAADVKEVADAKAADKETPGKKAVEKKPSRKAHEVESEDEDDDQKVLDKKKPLRKATEKKPTKKGRENESEDDDNDDDDDDDEKVADKRNIFKEGETRFKKGKVVESENEDDDEKEGYGEQKPAKKGKEVESEDDDEDAMSEDSPDDGDSDGSVFIDLSSSASEENDDEDDDDEDFQPTRKRQSNISAASVDSRKRKSRVVEESDEEEEEEKDEEDFETKSKAKKQKASAKQTLLAPVTKKRAPRKPAAKKARKNDDDDEVEQKDSDGLEPINKLTDMFDDMVKRNPSFVEAVKKLNGRPLRVATMCSGTESPLLALQLISRALKNRFNVNFAVDHVFSCEIEPFKQAYIERNFSPPLLFRDVRELGGEEATTAYGAKMPVPGEIDMLIAGTSCVDYSNLNNQKQTLDAKGESGETFRGMLRWVEKHRPPLVVLENVCSAPWDKIVKRFDTINYNARDVRADTKHYYIPHTRTRGYLLATPRCDILEDDVVDEWADLVKSLRRMSSTPLEDYLIATDDPRIHRARDDLAKTKDDSVKRGRTDWNRCQSRHSFQRLTEELGNGRPLTAWTEGGMSYLPDYAWNDWGRAQTDRVLDLMDINFLRLAKKGIDAQYKTLVWNLSQNVDRTTASIQPGICPCLTPSMIPYITNRGGPLIGLEALSLQGIPVDELLLTRETEDQLADLAGNAMTSTVVGTCMMAAMTLCIATVVEMQGKRTPEAQRFSKVITEVDDDLEEKERKLELSILGDKLLNTDELNLMATGTRSIEDILSMAATSARHCVCEGRIGIAKAPVKECKYCGHSACTSCGGRPEHSFKETKEVIAADDRVHPQAFQNALKEVLPVRLVLTGFSETALIDAGKNLDIESDFLASWAKIVSESVHGIEFRLSTFRRQEIWTCSYISPLATLSLCLDSANPGWKLVVTPPYTAPKNVIEVLKRPVAKMALTVDGKDAKTGLLKGEWKILMPQKIDFEMTVTGSDLGESWEQRIGLDGPFKNKTVWREYTVSGSDERLERNVDGVYKLLSKCGTAMESLHKKIDSDAEKSSTFLFLDPSRCGNREEDSFVFASTCRRLEYGEDREAFVILDTMWRPNSEQGPQKVACYTTGIFCTYTPAALQTPKPASDKMVATISLAKARDVFFTPLEDIVDGVTEELKGSCAVARCVVKVNVPVMDGSHDELWTEGWRNVDLVREGHAVFEQLAWFTEKISLPSWLGEWIVMENGLKGIEEAISWYIPLHYISSSSRFLFLSAMTVCQRCAPAEPQLLWINKKGSKAFEGIEDPSQAAVYEQSLKNRPSPFVVQLKGERPFGIFRVGINFASLIHRALSRLPSAQGQEVSLSWKLTTISEKAEGQLFRPFRLATNKNDKPYKQPPNFKKYPLRPEQLRSLAWMVAQESENVESFVEEEISEANLDHLGWRAEGRASRSVVIRGGVIADQVGYGKTAITLGLIDEMKGKHKLPNLEDVPGYIPLKATLVLVPGHLLNQWPDEIRKFLGSSVKVEVIKDMNSLNRLAIADLQAADIVVASSKLLSSTNYWENLEGISAGGRLPTNGKGGRYFLARYKEALRSLRKQTETLTTVPRGATDVYKNIKEARETDSTAATLELSKRLIGKSFSEEPEKKTTKKPAAKKKVETKKTKANPDPWRLTYDEVKKDWKRLRCPPFEMFHWSRVVVDEFTYLEDRIHTAVVNLSSTFRWVLSGTPPLKDFIDIKGIAVFLGVHLGVDDETNYNSQAAKKRRKEATKVEQFHSFREVHTETWHARRHALAQTFLDRFVRQNVAEIDEIPFEESIMAVRLPPAERAIYLELEHHLSAMEMNSKKAIRSKKEADGDRDRRMQISLGSSSTAEEALLKRCSHFDVEIVTDNKDGKKGGKGKKAAGRKRKGDDSESEEEEDEEEEEDDGEDDESNDDGSDDDGPSRKIPTRRSAKPDPKRLKGAEGKKAQPRRHPRRGKMERGEPAASALLLWRHAIKWLMSVKDNLITAVAIFYDIFASPMISVYACESAVTLGIVLQPSRMGNRRRILKNGAGCKLPMGWGERVAKRAAAAGAGVEGLQTIVRPKIEIGAEKDVKKGKKAEDDAELGWDEKEMKSKNLDELLFEVRERTHMLRRLDRELIGRVRSLRFLLVVRNLLKSAKRDAIVMACSEGCPGSRALGSEEKGDDMDVDAKEDEVMANIINLERQANCRGSSLRLRDVAILSCCGHIGCHGCMNYYASRNECPVPGCGVRSHDKAIVSAAELGTADEEARDGDEGSELSAWGTGDWDKGEDEEAKMGWVKCENTEYVSEDLLAPILSSSLILPGVRTTMTRVAASVSGDFGAKLLQLVRILAEVGRRNERALVFVQFTDLMEKVAEALESEGLGYLQIRGSTHQKSTALQAFQQQQPPVKGAVKPHVLLLHVMDESAAGANLTVANHVVFVGPLLAPTMEVYTAAETQAVGRCRRYGQTRRVYVHRLVTVGTIDEGIFKRRSEHLKRVQEMDAIEVEADR